MRTEHDGPSASLLTDASRCPTTEYHPETPVFPADGLAQRHMSKVDAGGLAGPENCQYRAAFAAVFIQVILWQVKVLSMPHLGSVSSFGIAIGPGWRPQKNKIVFN